VDDLREELTAFSEEMNLGDHAVDISHVGDAGFAAAFLFIFYRSKQKRSQFD